LDADVEGINTIEIALTKEQFRGRAWRKHMTADDWNPDFARFLPINKVDQTQGDHLPTFSVKEPEVANSRAQKAPSITRTTIRMAQILVIPARTPTSAIEKQPGAERKAGTGEDR